MLNKQFRLQLREETDFFSSSKKLHTPYFSLFYTESANFQATIIVTKKTFLLATKRNALKRKFRSALQSILENLAKLKIKVAIVVHAKSAELSVSEIAQQIEKNVQKIRI